MAHHNAPIRDFSYCLTSELDQFVSVKIACLEGAKAGYSYEDLAADPALLAEADATLQPDLYVTSQIFARNLPLTPQMRTAYQSYGGRRAELSNFTWNEVLHYPLKYCDLTPDAQIVFEVWRPSVSGDADSELVGGTTLRFFGKHRTLHKGRQRLRLFPRRACTDNGGDNFGAPSPTLAKQDKDSRIHRLEKLIKRYEKGDLPKLEWLDMQIFPRLEALRHEIYETTPERYLYVELAHFDFPFLFHEREYAQPAAAAAAVASAGSVAVEADLLAAIVDPEAQRENIVESKHRRLVRSTRTGPLDRELKPNARFRDELKSILRYPPTKPLSAYEKDLLWKFRFYLTRDRTALTKFLKAVDWGNDAEALQATATLLPLWEEIDVEDALELLGANFAHEKVREFAVAQLQRADDESLTLYLFQLVQALKFERSGMHFSFDSKAAGSALEDSGTLDGRGPLADFLVGRALRNPVMGNHFYWYLMVEWEDRALGRMFGNVCHRFLESLGDLPDGQHRRAMLLRQGELVTSLCTISKELRLSKESRPKKIERLRGFLGDAKSGFSLMEPLAFPLDPRFTMTGILADDALVMKSSLAPLKMTVRCADGTAYPVMFKNGDDLRQDQLVIQLITLMARLLKNENLDLRLTPYSVLATGNEHGFIQFVPSLPLASVLAEYNGSVQAYLRSVSPEPEALDTFGIRPGVMDAYVRSCAGYCVITYLLGIGDRHLDNLMLAPDGRLFHIDFGFILGKDPKPFPPPMKLCKEMVDCMGGMGSPHFARFRSYCYIAFNILRRSANLILNLFSLMVDANSPIRDLRSETDKVVLKVQEKFRLDLGDEEAIRYFDGLITDSVSALFPQVIETIHKWAQYWRK